MFIIPISAAHVHPLIIINHIASPDSNGGRGQILYPNLSPDFAIGGGCLPTEPPAVILQSTFTQAFVIMFPFFNVTFHQFLFM